MHQSVVKPCTPFQIREAQSFLSVPWWQIRHGQSAISFDTGTKARVYVFKFENVVKAIVARKSPLRHYRLSLYNYLYSGVIVHFRYRIRKNSTFALIYVILRRVKHRLLGVVRVLLRCSNVIRNVYAQSHFCGS